jgi:hypothetical protein
MSASKFTSKDRGALSSYRIGLFKSPKRDDPPKRAVSGVQGGGLSRPAWSSGIPIDEPALHLGLAAR